MHRIFQEPRLVIATHNPGKLAEIQAFFQDMPFDVTSAGALGLKDIDETGTTYLENATLKAIGAATASGLPALADDSGLELEALDNTPGVLTARYTKDHGGLAAVFDQWAQEARIAANPRASFHSTVVLAWADGHTESFTSTVPGRLTFPARGAQGHGYDPIFIADGYTKTNAELSLAEKNHVSHRGRALALLREACFR